MEYYAEDGLGNIESIHNETFFVDEKSPETTLWYSDTLFPVPYTDGQYHYINAHGTLIYLNSMRKFTLPLGLMMFRSDIQEMSWHLIMALSTAMLLPVLVLFFFAQKTFIQGVQMTGITGR